MADLVPRRTFGGHAVESSGTGEVCGAALAIRALHTNESEQRGIHHGGHRGPQRKAEEGPLFFVFSVVSVSSVLNLFDYFLRSRERLRRAIYCTAKTRTSAVAAPCGGTATKYFFSSGTSSPVLPSGPVGILPMDL